MKKVLLLAFCISSVVYQSAAQNNTALTIATYNIRYDNAGDSLNAWPNRKEDVKALIRFHDFDIFGTQEGLIHQIKGLEEMSEFGRIGVGRDDGRDAGEHSAIFYKKDRFRLLQSGNFWLSETPDTPGKGWDAKCCNRICSWAKFKDQVTQKEFYFFCVHFDHQGVEARRQSGKLMVKKIKEIAGNTPVVCVGDFNSTPDTEQIKEMQTILGDSYNVTQAPPYGPAGTFNAFRFGAPMKHRIDYIFVSPGITVQKYGVLTDAKDQRYPSDHQPVMIKANIN
ncbi:MAG: endonuclease/exonuclease/phosphatase family protein [Chitinophagaceae bacterium]|nr:endonuclease/exonuclease/phosphatase family protein [Chitinophagaceae bacterium]